MKSKKKIIQPLQTCIYLILILLAVVYIAPCFGCFWYR